MFRIGIGHDTHRLVEGRPLIIGGVTIEAERGAEGHSDADALVHAIADAILGAMGDGDIGMHFPDRDSQWKNIDSLQLLARVMWLVRERGMRVVNVDSNVLLERPKLRSHIQAMRENLANVIGIEAALISIKAKTGEGMDAVGMGDAITAQAIVLVEQGVKSI
jgi:2-C-methyl-D-erythritol 2,4-cyclodiphosphate synthase